MNHAQLMKNVLDELRWNTYFGRMCVRFAYNHRETTLDPVIAKLEKQCSIINLIHQKQPSNTYYPCSINVGTPTSCGNYNLEMTFSDGKTKTVKEFDRENFLTETMQFLLENVDFGSTYCPTIVRRKWCEKSRCTWVIDNIQWSYSHNRSYGTRRCRTDQTICDTSIGSSILEETSIPFFVWGDLFDYLMNIS